MGEQWDELEAWFMKENKGNGPKDIPPPPSEQRKRGRPRTGMSPEAERNKRIRAVKRFKYLKKSFAELPAETKRAYWRERSKRYYERLKEKGGKAYKAKCRHERYG